MFAALCCGSESDCHLETRGNCQCSVEFEGVICPETGVTVVLSDKSRCLLLNPLLLTPASSTDTLFAQEFRG